jgi:hypothetical protein
LGQFDSDARLAIQAVHNAQQGFAAFLRILLQWPRFWVCTPAEDLL